MSTVKLDTIFDVCSTTIYIGCTEISRLLMGYHLSHFLGIDDSIKAESVESDGKTFASSTTTNREFHLPSPSRRLKFQGCLMLECFENLLLNCCLSQTSFLSCYFDDRSTH